MLFATISFTISGSVLLFSSFLLFLILLTFLFYKFTIPPIPTIKRLTLSIIRALSLTLLLLILFEPILSLIKIESKAPSIAVLLDNTQSLNISNTSNQQVQKLKEYLSKGKFNQIAINTNVKYYTFTDQLSSYENFSDDTLNFSGEITDISNSFNKLKDKIKPENHQAVILISDGNYNVGKNPIYEAENLGIPVYTIGIGDTSEQKDVLISKIVTNNIVYAETRIPVDATIKWSGCSSENAEVTLSEDGAVVDKQIISLVPGTNEKSIRLYFEPKEEGTKKLTVSVSNIPDEVTVKNNYKSTYVKVLKSKLNILLIAGSPSPDVTVIRQTLIEDQHFNVNTLIQKNRQEFYYEKFRNELLDSADCFVFVGFPASSTGDEIIRAIAISIEKQRKPILFVSGKNIDYGKLQNIESFLPFNWMNVSNIELNVFASILEKSKNNPLVNLSGLNTQAEGIGIESWNDLPPIYKTQTQHRLKPEAEVLANVKLQTIPINEPLILTRNISRYKSIAITGYGIWRWRLLAQSSNQTKDFLSLFLSNSVRWLTTKEDDKNVRVTPTKEVYTTADVVEFTGQVYDNQYRLIDNAELKVSIFSGKDKVELTLDAVGNGRYEGQISGLKEGDYNYLATASTYGKVLGEDKGKFAIGKINIEFFDTKMNKQILEQIAYLTGGMYFDISNLEGLPAVIANQKFAKYEFSSITELEIWNWELLAAIIIILLALEWFIRKRNGML